LGKQHVNEIDNNWKFWRKLKFRGPEYKKVRFQVLMAARMKMAIFWVVAPLVTHRPDDGGSKHL
jgi:hypothetical protein